MEVVSVFVEDFADFILAVITLLAIVLAFGLVEEVIARRRDRLAPVCTHPSARR
jgi:hypothetical protein